jgi:hypothetical protein
MDLKPVNPSLAIHCVTTFVKEGRHFLDTVFQIALSSLPVSFNVGQLPSRFNSEGEAFFFL